MNLYVVRHGETDMGKNKIIATEDEPLNFTGIEQAKNLGKELSKLNIDIVYCSPIDRAKHTLNLFNLNKNIPIIVDERLKERDMGIYKEVPFEYLEWENFWGYNSNIKYPELESMKSVYKRVSKFLDEIKIKNDTNILLVTHGGVSRAIYWYFYGIDNSLFVCENCKIYKYIM